MHWRCLIACASLVGASAAHAQLSGSATLVSDYRFRGVSLSNGEPAAQAGAVFDAANGVYTGLFVSSVRIAPHLATGLEAVGDLGYAVRGARGITWDFGAAYTHITRPDHWDYADYYVGAAGTEWRGQLSYAPRYFGRPYSAVYAELDLTPDSQRQLAPVLHVGWLNSEPSEGSGARSRWDGRLGVAYSSGRFTLQLHWVMASHEANTYGAPDKSTWVVRATAWL